MSTIPFGPVTVTNLPTTVGPAPLFQPQRSLIFDTGQVGTISGLEVFVTTSIVGYTGTANVVQVVWFNSLDAEITQTQTPLLGWAQSTPVHWIATPPALATRAQILYATAMDATGPFASTTTTATVNGSVTATSGTDYCAYGTEPNPDATTWSVVTSTILDVVVDATCIALGQPQLAVIATTALLAIEGTVLRQPDCTVLPPPVAPLDLSLSVLFNPTTRLAWFDAAYWHYF